VATEVKQRNNRVIVIAGAVVAVAAFLGVVLVSRSGNGSTSSTPTVNVVVAAADLPQGTQLTAGMLKTAAVPTDTAPTGAYVDATQAVGKFLSVSVTANTPITPGLTVQDKVAAGTAALSAQPLSITAGYVALAIPGGTDLQSIGCNIHPEDHIDILINPGNNSVRYAFQDVRVLGVGDYGAATTPCPAPSLVVELPRAQAETLTFLTTPNLGPQVVLKYVLRPHNDYGKAGQPKYLDNGNPAVPQPADPGANASSVAGLFPGR
jgi:Flp pilus assembly protein CpaB